MKRGIALLILAVLIAGLTGIGVWTLRLRTLPADTRPKVAASIYPLSDIVRSVAGDRLQTVELLPVGASPHTYEPSPGDVKRISGATTLFVIGHGLDGWAVTTAQNAGVTDVVTVDRGIGLIADTGNPAEANPHYFLSLKNARIIAATVRDTLSAEYPRWQTEFSANYDRFVAGVDLQYAKYAAAFRSVPDKNIATFHNAWSYYARDYGLTVAAVFEEFPGKSPSPQYVKEFETTIRGKHLHVVFAEPQLSLDTLKPIADDLNVTIAILDPLGGTPGRTTYLDLLSYNSTIILGSLTRNP